MYKDINKKRENAKRYYKQNKVKIYKQTKKWRKENPNKIKIYQQRAKFSKFKSKLKYRYGITYEKYLLLLKQQNNCCAICGKDSTELYEWGIPKLLIDHNHITGKVRGLLCKKCNTGLGAFNDSIHLLKKSTNYLEKSND
jgi:hypothetical protein